MHHDGSYWPLEPMEVVTLLVGRRRSTPANGCMRVVPGTHTSELHKMSKFTDTPNVLGSQMVPALVDEDQAVDIVLEAGGVSSTTPTSSTAQIPTPRASGAAG